MQPGDEVVKRAALDPFVVEMAEDLGWFDEYEKGDGAAVVRAVLGAIFSADRPPRTPAPCFSLPPADPDRFSRDSHDA